MLERLTRHSQSLRLRNDRPYLKQKSVRFSEDGRGKPQLRDIMNQMLSPTIMRNGFDFRLDGSGSQPLGRRAIPPRGVRQPHLDSSQPGASHTSSTYRTMADDSVRQRGPHWHKSQLLDISDSVRSGLRVGHVSSSDTENLSNFLEAALKDEERSYPTLNFETIEHARLDKLLSEIIQFADLMISSNLSPYYLLRLRVNVSQSKHLRRLWRRRFREHFFMIDQHRRAVLVESPGRLKDVSFNSSLDYDLGKWQTTRVTGPVSEVEANLQFEPGHWWLNITCAERDGIVNNSQEIPTTGCYGFPTLPLLTGSEEMTNQSPHGNILSTPLNRSTVKYVREGSSSDMHVPLISQVGRKIRIIRGYKLKSIYAPEAGLRYDGLYIIRQYGCKFDSSANQYRLELTLERAAGQRSFEDVRKVPKPSQLDDWSLYEKLEGDKVKLLQGELSYLEWKLKQQEEKADREAWQRAQLFKSSFSLGSSRDERASKSSFSL
ncbi:hypothetical protein F4808DRAFT_427744 [Astrocystis sublimbata]|nr:hypothetical protein F4808DRAFT_427744 [Astrocystis sublimbata]